MNLQSIAAAGARLRTVAATKVNVYTQDPPLAAPSRAGLLVTYAVTRRISVTTPLLDVIAPPRPKPHGGRVVLGVACQLGVDLLCGVLDFTVMAATAVVQAIAFAKRTTPKDAYAIGLFLGALVCVYIPLRAACL